jgi:hypothetical protein
VREVCVKQAHIFVNRDTVQHGAAAVGLVSCVLALMLQSLLLLCCFKPVSLGVSARLLTLVLCSASLTALCYDLQVTAQGEKHARYRNALNPLFLQPAAVASYVDAIAQEVTCSVNLSY